MLRKERQQLKGRWRNIMQTIIEHTHALFGIGGRFRHPFSTAQMYSLYPMQWKAQQ